MEFLIEESTFRGLKSYKCWVKKALNLDRFQKKDKLMV